MKVNVILPAANNSPAKMLQNVDAEKVNAYFVVSKNDEIVILDPSRVKEVPGYSYKFYDKKQNCTRIGYIKADDAFVYGNVVYGKVNEKTQCRYALSDAQRCTVCIIENRDGTESILRNLDRKAPAWRIHLNDGVTRMVPIEWVVVR